MNLREHTRPHARRALWPARESERAISDNQSSAAACDVSNGGRSRSAGPSVYWSIGLLVYRSVCWSIGRSIGLLVGLLVQWSVYRSVYWSSARSIGLLVYWSSGRSIGLLVFLCLWSSGRSIGRSVYLWSAGCTRERKRTAKEHSDNLHLRREQTLARRARLQPAMCSGGRNRSVGRR